MKTLLLFAFLLILSEHKNDSDFYNISYSNVNGALMNTSTLKGKKVIIAVISLNASLMPMISYLDSVQRANSNVTVLAVPTADFGGRIAQADLVKLQKKLKLVITAPLMVKRSHGNQQHPFFVWLTAVSGNKHFESDVDEEGKTFVISASGTLYSVLSSNTPFTVLDSVINQDFKE